MRSVFRKILTVILIALFAAAVGLGTIGNFGHKSYVAELAISVLLVLLLKPVVRKTAANHTLEEGNTAHILLSLTVLFLLLNGSWALLFRPIQAADYQTFWQAASDLARNGRVQAVDYLAMFPHILGYASFLSVFLKLFGQHVLVAALLNVLLSYLSGLIIFRVVQTRADTAAAVKAFFLWMICPSKMLYNTMVLSEPYYTFLILAFVLLISELENQEDERRTAAFAAGGIAGGVLLGLTNTARPIGAVPIIALILWLVFLKKRGKHAKKWGVSTICLLAVYCVTGFIWNQYTRNIIGQDPPKIPGYNIYVGFNTETGGSYSDEDMTWFQSRYFGEFHQDAQSTQNAMLESALDRVQTCREQIPILMLNKLKTLLGNDEGGAFYAKESMQPRMYQAFCAVSNIWYYAVCILMFIKLGAVWRGKGNDLQLLVMLCGTGIILAQLLVEVASRYHYPVIPLLVMLTAMKEANSGSTIKSDG